MNIWNPRKWSNVSNQRLILVFGSLILLSLFLFTLALAKRPESQANLPVSPGLNLAQNLGFTILKGNSAGSNPKLPIRAPSAAGQNCTNTVQHWLSNSSNWPTDNLVVGKFTFGKEEILSIFQSEPRDEVTKVQQQFLSAALNILKGADSSSIEGLMAESSAWLNDHPAKIDLTEQEKAHGLNLASRLADFNHGTYGPGLCPDNPPEPPPTTVPTPAPTTAQPDQNYASSSTINDMSSGQQIQAKRKRAAQDDSQNLANLPTSTETQSNPPPVAAASTPAAPDTPSGTETISSPVVSPGPGVSNPEPSQDPPRTADHPLPQQPSGPGNEPQGKSKEPKVKKNPKHPPKEQPPVPAALPSQPDNATPPQSPGPGDSQPPVPPDNGKGMGNGNNNGGGNGNGNGNGNGHGNGGGKGKGHGKKP